MHKIYVIFFNKSTMSQTPTRTPSDGNNNSRKTSGHEEEEVVFVCEIRGEPPTQVDGQYINSLCAPWQQQFRRDPDSTLVQNMSAWLSYRESQRDVARYERDLRMEAERLEREERLEEEERAYQQSLAQERVDLEETNN
jgi:hypothetical protein